MKVHEYQARQILERYNVAMPPGIVATTATEAVDAAEKLAEKGATMFVVKAQIHAGGRGKGGGVKLAHSLEEVRLHAEAILGMQLVTHQTGPQGQRVRKVLITSAVDIAREYYLGITLDRGESQDVIMASTEGGVDIETVAAETPEKITKVWVDHGMGLLPFQVRKIAYSLGFTGTMARQAGHIIRALYAAYKGVDASLVEINPLVLTTDGQVVALDAKISLDDNALYRHRDLKAMRDLHEEAPLEVEASEYDLNYIKLDGNVGCMVNGAGLAMATMDLIMLAGGKPANFLDVGGAARQETIEAGFRIILKDANVKAVLVNIFGGIVRCDVVARGLVAAAQKLNITLPLIIRLQGTNAEEGQRILKESGLAVETAVLFAEVKDKVHTLSPA